MARHNVAFQKHTYTLTLFTMPDQLLHKLDVERGTKKKKK